MHNYSQVWSTISETPCISPAGLYIYRALEQTRIIALEIVSPIIYRTLIEAKAGSTLLLDHLKYMHTVPTPVSTHR